LERASLKHYGSVILDRLSSRQLRDRLHVIDGVLAALDRWDEISDCVARSEDRSEARKALVEMPFSFSEVQAEHVLDLAVGRRTAEGRRRVQEERERVVEALQSPTRGQDWDD